jgi:hypothetical protein
VDPDGIDLRLVTQDGIDRLLSFIPYFEATGSGFGSDLAVEKVDDKTFELLPATLSGKALDFFDACYAGKFVQDFDWQGWREEHESELASEAFIGRADLATIVRLLTVHLRADHFCNGHLLSIMRDGTILGILRRLLEVCESGREVKMTTVMDKIDIDNAITDVCVKIIQEPLLYFSEADVQQMLVQALNGIDGLGVPVETTVPRGLGSKGKYSTQLVHREYGAGEGRRVDVVIFDPVDAAKIDDANLMIKGAYLKPLYAFEIGTEKTADTAAHLKNDLAKLSCVKGTGYIIHIFKDTTLAPTGSDRRSRTEIKIIESFWKPFELSCVDIASDVRVLAILLRTGRNQARMRGKCAIFDRQQQDWANVNVNDETRIRSAIQKQLA